MPGVAVPSLFGGKPLLVYHIEDSFDDRLLFETACKMACVPMESDFAESSTQGIAYLRSLVERSHTQPVRWPDVVVLDIFMPAYSGLEVLKFIRASPELRTLPVIIFSGSINSELALEAYNLGANSFIIKPCAFEDTLKVVQALYNHWSCAVLPSRRMQSHPPAFGAGAVP
jgi:CheY-like chemotaxis protein